jgi:nucleoid-associated protein YgaU
MSDPFAPSSRDQLVREAQRGLVIVGVLLAIFFYVAFDRFSGRGRDIPEHVRNAPVARTVWPNSQDSPHADERRSERELQRNSRLSENSRTSSEPINNGVGEVALTDFVERDGSQFKEEKNAASAFVNRREAPKQTRNDHNLSNNSLIRRTDSEVREVQREKSPKVLQPKHDSESKSVVNSPMQPVDQLDDETFEPLPDTNRPFEHALNDANSLARYDQNFSSKTECDENAEIEGSAENVELVQHNSPILDAESQRTFASNENAGPKVSTEFEPSPKTVLTQQFLAAQTNFSESDHDSKSFQAVPQLVAPKIEFDSLPRDRLSHLPQPPKNDDAFFDENTSGELSQDPVLPARHHLVDGESFYSIAQRYYGDGRFFRALYQFNAERIREYDSLSAGTLIVVPTIAELQQRFPAEVLPLATKGTQPTSAKMNWAVEDQPEPARTDLFREKTFANSSNDIEGMKPDSRDRFHTPSKTYTTQGGETLFEIAARQLGQASRYLEIMELNRARLGRQINESSRLPGNLLLIMPGSPDR